MLDWSPSFEERGKVVPEPDADKFVRALLVAASEAKWIPSIDLVDVSWLGRMELARDVPEWVTLADTSKEC